STKSPWQNSRNAPSYTSRRPCNSPETWPPPAGWGNDLRWMARTTSFGEYAPAGTASLGAGSFLGRLSCLPEPRERFRGSDSTSIQGSISEFRRAPTLDLELSRTGTVLEQPTGGNAMTLLVRIA